jgi:RNA polymerase sigma-70 factor (ECF subfamily)
MGPPNPEDEADLLRRIAAGDEEAFGLLFARYEPMLRRFAEERLPAKLRRRVSAADVLQEAHLGAFGKREGFEDRGPGSFRNWLLRIVEFKVNDAVRRHARAKGRAAGREVTRAARAETGAFPGRQPSPSQVAVGAEMADLARRALESLSESDREVVRLVREEHLTLAEVGRRTGRTREAAKKSYGRAMARFTREFERIWGENLG